MFWFRQLQAKLSRNSLDEVSKAIEDSKQYIPSEFKRKMRPLKDLAFWKASEYRLFLLYFGCVPLKNHTILSKPRYVHFLKLCISIRLMHMSKLTKDGIDICKTFLREFSLGSARLYGKSFVSYNVHSVMHLTDDYLRYGSLDRINCFPFESYLGILKSTVRSAYKPLQQVAVRAFHENENIVLNASAYDSSRPVFFHSVSRGVTLPVDLYEESEITHYRSAKLRNGFLIKRSSEKDSCIAFDKNRVGLVCDIIDCKGLKYFVVNELKSVVDYFVEPINSMAAGIYLASSKSKNFLLIPISRVKAKCFLLPIRHSKWVAIEILHSLL